MVTRKKPLATLEAAEREFNERVRSELAWHATGDAIKRRVEDTINRNLETIVMAAFGFKRGPYNNGWTLADESTARNLSALIHETAESTVKEALKGFQPKMTAKVIKTLQEKFEDEVQLSLHNEVRDLAKQYVDTFVRNDFKRASLHALIKDTTGE